MKILAYNSIEEALEERNHSFKELPVTPYIGRVVRFPKISAFNLIPINPATPVKTEFEEYKVELIRRVTSNMNRIVLIKVK